MARWKKPKPPPLADPAALAGEVERALEGGPDVVQAAREVLAWLEELEREQGSLSPAAQKLRRYFRSAVDQWQREP